MSSNFYQLPPLLVPGDTVKAIAPSGALKETAALEAGLNIWRSHEYKVKFGLNYNKRFGYLAGDDNIRRQALQDAWQDPECQAILCIRGGYGGARLLENWQWDLPSIKPKWIIGFSDVTALLWSLATVKIASLHAPVLTTLAQEPQWSQERMFNYLQTGKLDPLQGKTWQGGTASGILLPANLTVATHLLKTPLQPSFDGVILVLEDVTEYPYRIDRMLTQWRLMGAFARVKGIALGRFSRCEPYPGSNSWTVEEVLRDRFTDLNIPIVADLPFGHDGANAALPVGQKVTLDGDSGKLMFDE
ncbi:putative enzyme [Hyella patelloides LEGE 07179]|uniref:Putative enzyme n=1 Tax=Hyella patelloides LEGE 07179 TaxID=945734 RepID=A0A563VMU9_9CYAN|nr:LD-carboxypeptidase [Hyella patelloides]VEP12748.1 putative enzyme [Hyella patelloides LEGE 07179]